MNNSVTVIAPKTDNDGRTIDQLAYINKLTDAAGGCTVKPAQGYWIDEKDNKLYKDSNNLLESSFLLKDLNKVAQASADIVKSLMIDGGQLQVSFITSTNGLTIYEQSDTVQEIAKNIISEFN